MFEHEFPPVSARGVPQKGDENPQDDIRIVRVLEIAFYFKDLLGRKFLVSIDNKENPQKNGQQDRQPFADLLLQGA